MLLRRFLHSHGLLLLNRSVREATPFMRSIAATRNPNFRHSILAEGIAVTLLIALFFMWKSPYIAQQLVPVWDGNVYLLDAHDLLTGQQLYIWNYPLLVPGIVALVWSVMGENYLPMRFLNLTFTLATAVALYYSTRSEFGKIPSFLAAILYLTSIEILIWSDQLAVYGPSSFFAVLALVTWRKHSYSASIAGAVFAALSCLARYSVVSIAFPIFIAFAIANRKRPRLIVAAIFGACIPILVYHLAFPFVLPRFLDIYLGYGFHSGNLTLPYYYYVANWHSFFGIIGVFGLLALFLPSTYRNDSSRAWAFWLIGSLVFFTITLQKFDAYTFQWTPAVVYLSFMFLIKIKDTLLTHASQSRFEFLSERLSGSFNPKVFGTLLIFLVLLQSCTFASAYLQYERNAQPVFYRDNNLFAVADYLKTHIPSNATFVTDYCAPALAYFSGRYGLQIWEHTNDTEYLDHLHGYMQSVDARYVIIFPNLTGNSAKVLEDSDFLILEDTLNVTVIGPVYVFHLT